MGRNTMRSSVNNAMRQRLFTEYLNEQKQNTMKIGDKFKIIENIEDHIGYKEGRELTIKSIEPNDYITAEEGDWYIGLEETDIIN